MQWIQEGKFAAMDIRDKPREMMFYYLEIIIKLIICDVYASPHKDIPWVIYDDDLSHGLEMCVQAKTWASRTSSTPRPVTNRCMR